MSEPLIIWIVEDRKDEASAAWKVVEDVGRDVGGKAVIYWTNEFGFAPQVRTSLDAKQVPSTTAEYPDIVVLDLCKETPNGEKLQGNEFYSALRKWESHKPGGRPSLVILWSLHQGRQDTDRFVKGAIDADNRVIPLASKQPQLLRSLLAEIWGRVIEERENE